MLAHLLQDAGERPCCLSRGYGGSLAGPQRVDAKVDGAAQVGLAFKARARPAPRRALLLSVARLVADLAAAIALYLTSNGRWRAIQSCRDLPERAAIGLKAGNLAAVVQ